MAAPLRLEGVVWILVATACYAGMAAFTKRLMADLDVFAIVFWRSVLVTGVALVASRAFGESVRPRHWGRLGLRSGLGLVAMLLYFWCLGQIPLGVGTTLLYTSPLFTVLLSGVVLGEARSRVTLPLALVAFVGVLMIAWPEETPSWGSNATLGVAAGLGSGLLAGLAYLTVRKLRETETSSGIVLFFALFSAVATAPMGLRNGLPDLWPHAAMLLGVGVFAGMGQLAMTHAYRIEKASLVGPFSYAQIVFSFTLGLLLFDEKIDVLTGVGMAIVIGAGAVLSRQASARAPDPR
jgi:drug/metabolite transporter (DMT)-like permease